MNGPPATSLAGEGHQNCGLELPRSHPDYLKKSLIFGCVFRANLVDMRNPRGQTLNVGWPLMLRH